MCVDQTQIMRQFVIIYLFKTFKLIITILGTSYFIGMFWYIMCDLMMSIEPEMEKFITHFGLDENTSLENAVLVNYYAFTSLSTVGFGDLNPRSNTERMLCAVILLFGNAIFGYIIGNFN